MPEEHTEPVQDEIAQEAGELILEAEENLQEKRAEQQAFLDTVAEEEGAEELETTCNIMGEYVVDVSAKLDGEVMDTMGRIDARLERVQSGDARAYEIGDTADEISQLLADVIDDDGSEWTKETFYQAYENEGIDPLGVMLRRVFESLKDEKERRQGTADGFRQE